MTPHDVPACPPTCTPTARQVPDPSSGPTARRTRPCLALATVCLLLAPMASAQTAGGHAGHGTPAAPPATGATTAPEWVPGEVRRVDRENRKVTLRHGEIRSLQMPPMTMVFEVRDPALLDGLQPGKRIRFAAEEVKGAYVVTAVEPAQ